MREREEGAMRSPGPQPKDPVEWITRFFEVHQARFLGMPWPEPDSAEYVEMVGAWVHHFRLQDVTQKRANAASLALMAVKHYPNNHLAEFLACLPERPVHYHEASPDAAAHWAKGDGRLGNGRVCGLPSDVEVRAEIRRRAKFKADVDVKSESNSGPGA